MVNARQISLINILFLYLSDKSNKNSSLLHSSFLMPTLTLVFSNESLLCIYIYPDVPRREYILNGADSCKNVKGDAHV